MQIEDFAYGIAEKFQIDCSVVSPVIEEYLFKKISPDQFKKRLKVLILQRSHTELPLENL